MLECHTTYDGLVSVDAVGSSSQCVLLKAETSICWSTMGCLMTLGSYHGCWILGVCVLLPASWVEKVDQLRCLSSAGAAWLQGALSSGDAAPGRGGSM